ncbi:DUF1835 domain-containing protein [Bacillus mesophilum]|uniref:DUF1835 domain-containing protein n=1 Tax=Bacillus mesophilum TaxID=1071718 RepID=A0A7V7UTN6_9BACI|nr:DUF1835 domain-containing protein [Bacillus mesophilum]KAB2330652.1 DUF1835 domain-containing protein [Bacillus mesophilum]
MELESMKKTISSLSETDAKSLLLLLFAKTNQWKQMGKADSELAMEIEKMYNGLERAIQEERSKKQIKEYERIHIVFGASPAGSLRVALKTMELEHKEKIIVFGDMLSIGPVYQLHTEEGQEKRANWMLTAFPYDEEDWRISGYEKNLHEITAINENQPITIWCSNSAHEQTALRFVLFLLKERKNQIQVINAADLHEALFKKKDIEYQVLHTGEIPPEKLQIIYEKNNGKNLTKQDRETLEQEWLSLAETKTCLRISIEGMIVSADEAYFDKEIIETARELGMLDEFKKSARLIGQVLGECEQHIGDSFIEYRLRKLIEKDIFEVKGSLKAMRFYSVRLKI